MKLARPTTSQKCVKLSFPNMEFLILAISKHLLAILFWLFQILELLITI